MRKAIAFVALMICSVSLHAKAESALEIQSWCKGIVNAKLGANHTIFYTPNYNTGFCWGAFGAIQEFSRFLRNDNTPMIDVCAPPNSTRLQLIKIFSKYVDDHPESANRSFAIIALRALTRAFPCTGVGPQR